MSDIVVHCAPPFGYSFGVVDRGVRMFDPTSLPLRGWWRANYVGAPWVGRATAGVSGSRDLPAPAGPYTTPTVSPNTVNGYTPAKFISASLTTFTCPGLAGDYVVTSTNRYSGWALIYVYTIERDDPANPYLNEAICSESASYWFIYMRAGGLVGLQHVDGGSTRNTAITPIFTRVWQLVQWRYDGTSIQIRVNNGAWSTTTAPALGGGSGNPIYIGANYGLGLFMTADLLDMALTDVAFSDAQFDNILAYCQTRYGLALDTRVFDPAVSLSLLDYWRANYTGTPWLGTPGVGTSGGNQLDATSGGETPAVLSPVNGFTAADFDGTNDFVYKLGGFGAGSATMANYFVWALVYIDAISTNDTTHAYNNDAILADYGGAFGLHLRSGSGVTKAQFYHYDGAERVVEIDVTTGQWTLLQFRYDGTNISAKVDSGSIQTTAASAPTALGADLQIGRNYNFAQFLDGKVMELGVMTSRGGDALFDRIREYVNARYKLSL